MLNVVIKGVIFICTNCGLRLSHFNSHIQISEEQYMFIDHFLILHYEGYFKNAQGMLVVWAILDLGRYLTFNGYVISITCCKETHISCYPCSTLAPYRRICMDWLLSFPKWMLSPAGFLRMKLLVHMKARIIFSVIFQYHINSLLLFVVLQLLSHVQLFVIPWPVAYQAPLSSPRVCSNSCQLSRWCCLTISSSAAPFCYGLQSFPASVSFPISRFFTSGVQSIGALATASILSVNIQGWFPLGLGLSWWLSRKSTCEAEDMGLIPGSGRSPGRGSGNPLQYSCYVQSHGQRTLVGYSPWDHKELDMTEQSPPLGLAGLILQLKKL